MCAKDQKGGLSVDFAVQANLFAVHIVLVDWTSEEPDLNIRVQAGKFPDAEIPRYQLASARESGVCRLADMTSAPYAAHERSKFTPICFAK
jgi:hypothetical protein